MAAQAPTQHERHCKVIARLCGLAVLGLGLTLGLSGCQTCRTCGRPAERAAEQELVQVDREFCALAQQRGVAEAFRTYAAEDAMLLPMGDNPIQGRSAIFAAMAEGPKYTLEWSPQASEVARSGDLGYTWGKSVIRRTGEDGKPTVRYGKYLTVWKRQSDGSWKYVMDIGNPSPAPN